VLIIIVASATSSSLSISSSTTTTSTPSSTAAAPSSSSATPVGVIAGGVVGGVLGIAVFALLVWLVMRRRGKSKAADPYVLQGMDRHEADPTETTKYRHTASPVVHEVEGGRTEHELPAPQKPVELPAEQSVKQGKGQ
jgi:hypothetical protein